MSAVLIRPDPTTGAALLPTTSVVRAAVERARMDIVRWIGKKNRWQFVHSAGGFEEMESWAVKEISDGMYDHDISRHALTILSRN